jgi:hypothetical protein
MSNWQKFCSRCGADASGGSIMSKFNLDIICMACKRDEEEAPGYQAASDAELEAVKNKNYNFPGVGLSEADKKFLAERWAKRSKGHERKTPAAGD